MRNVIIEPVALGENDAKKLEKWFHGYLLGCCNTLKELDDASLIEIVRDSGFMRNNNKCVPDYTDGDKVAYYQLRYAGGYAFDYYYAYRLALRWLKTKWGNPDGLSAVSLGCGCGLDWYPYQLAAHEENYKGTLFWRGIDTVRWGKPKKTMNGNKRYPFPPNEEAITILDDGAMGYFNYLRSHNIPCDADILLFPRVLTELEKGDIDDLAEAISGVSFSKNELVVCVANTGNPQLNPAYGGTRWDEERGKIERILTAFEGAGNRERLSIREGNKDKSSDGESIFPRLDDGEFFFIDPGCDKAPGIGIKRPDKDTGARIDEVVGSRHLFTPGRKEKEFLKDLENVEELKSCKLNPITLTTQMNLQIVMFEKKAV